MGRCKKDVGDWRWEPVSLGINLATGSTNRLSPPISCHGTDSYLYCQAAAAAAAQDKREGGSKQLWRIGESCESKCKPTGNIWWGWRGGGVASSQQPSSTNSISASDWCLRHWRCTTGRNKNIHTTRGNNRVRKRVLPSEIKRKQTGCIHLFTPRC